MAKGFSIIVCCYNSGKMLPATLAELSKLMLPPGIPTEIILVDNCSTDETAQIARSQWECLGEPFPLEVIFEAKPGLSYARMCGIAASHFEFLVFCDDDNWLRSDYLVAAGRLLEDHPQIGMAGGLGLPHYEQIPSYWSADFYIYGSGPQAPAPGPVTTLHGAGAILRRQAIDKLTQAGFSFLLTDRKGDSLASGGDFELCFAVALAGYTLWYTDALHFSHFIPPERLTRSYCKRFIRESAPAVNVLDVYNHVLAGGKHAGIRFFLKQFKFMAHHVRSALAAIWLELKYRNNEKVLFLEQFHLRYHLRRIQCIPGNLFSYGKMMRQISMIRARLETEKEAGSLPGLP